MKRRSRQSGFSLVELMVGMTILVIIFGGSFQVLSKVRTTAKAQDTSGPHMFFETFASARLRLYYSKLMQWIAHVGAPDCSDARRYAYASNDVALPGGPSGNPLHNNRTLGADMRMSLSTLNYGQVAARGLTGRLNDDAETWGALVPFSSRNVAPDAIFAANAGLASFCDANGALLEDSQGTARELCAWVETCSNQRGNRRPTRPPNPDVTNDGVPYLSASQLGGLSVQGLNGLSRFRMCFAFVGNLFSRSGNVVTAAPERELEVIDNPSVLGLVVATANFRNTNTGAALTCNQAVNEMYRSMNVGLNIYTVLNAESTVASRKQLVFKTMKEFSSEKIGASVPNCRNRPSIPVNGIRPICISAPTWLYQCPEREQCAEPVPIVVR
jgi:prepilin-type N-terminal cleavage/methylation domain-containing protein